MASTKNAEAARIFALVDRAEVGEGQQRFDPRIGERAFGPDVERDRAAQVVGPDRSGQPLEGAAGDAQIRLERRAHQRGAAEPLGRKRESGHLRGQVEQRAVFVEQPRLDPTSSLVDPRVEVDVHAAQRPRRRLAGEPWIVGVARILTLTDHQQLVGLDGETRLRLPLSALRVQRRIQLNAAGGALDAGDREQRRNPLQIDVPHYRHRAAQVAKVGHLREWAARRELLHRDPGVGAFAEGDRETPRELTFLYL